MTAFHIKYFVFFHIIYMYYIIVNHHWLRVGATTTTDATIFISSNNNIIYVSNFHRVCTCGGGATEKSRTMETVHNGVGSIVHRFSYINDMANK